MQRSVEGVDQSRRRWRRRLFDEQAVTRRNLAPLGLRLQELDQNLGGLLIELKVFDQPEIAEPRVSPSSTIRASLGPKSSELAGKLDERDCRSLVQRRQARLAGRSAGRRGSTSPDGGIPGRGRRGQTDRLG